MKRIKSFFLALLLALLVSVQAFGAIQYTTATGDRHDRGVSGDSFWQSTGTLSFYYMPLDTSQARPIASWTSASDTRLAKNSSDKLVLIISGSTVITGSTTVVSGTWYHVNLTRNGGGNGWEIKLGTIAAGVASEGTATNAHTPSGNELIFSADMWNGGGCNCKIAWPRLWASVLSSGEMDSERTSTTPVKASPYSAYDFTDTTTAPTDLSGNSRTLTQQGTPTNTSNPSIGGGGAAVRHRVINQ